MVLDLVDFKDRVRPMSNDIAMLEQSMRFQKQNAQDMLQERAEFRQVIDEIRGGMYSDRLGEGTQPEEGYSSLEIEAPAHEAAVEEHVAEAIHEEPVEEVAAAEQHHVEEEAPVEEHHVEEVHAEEEAAVEDHAVEEETVEESRQRNFGDVYDEDKNKK